MSGEFEYDRPVAPIERQVYSLEQLFSNLTPVENEPTNFRGAIYAEPGLGKTYAGIELAQRITPANKAIVYIYTGTNWDSFKDVPALCQRVLKKPYTNMDELVAFVEAFHKYPEETKKFPVGTIVFDEHNTMFDDDVDTITSINAALLLKEKKKYKDPHTPEWPDYNMGKMHMKTIMTTTLQVSDINFIFLCHERDGKKSMKKEPDYFDKASQEFMRPLSCMYRLTTQIIDGVVVRTFQTQGTDQVTAKNRISKLPPFISGNDAVAQIASAFLSWSAAEKAKQTPRQEAEAPKAPAESPNESEPAETPVKESEVSVTSPQKESEDSSQANPTAPVSDNDELRALLGI